jgi:hypothetical protein
MSVGPKRELKLKNFKSISNDLLMLITIIIILTGFVFLDYQVN